MTFFRELSNTDFKQFEIESIQAVLIALSNNEHFQIRATKLLRMLNDYGIQNLPIEYLNEISELYVMVNNAMVQKMGPSLLQNKIIIKLSMLEVKKRCR